VLKVWMSPAGMLYGVGRDVVRWTGSGWQVMLTGTQATSFEDISGTDDNNIVAVGLDGMMHFNGSTWMEITSYPQTNLTAFQSVHVTSRGVFVLGYSTKPPEVHPTIIRGR
jgi:hypothetical protein